MAFRLKPREPITRGLRRLVTGELKSARSALREGYQRALRRKAMTHTAPHIYSPLPDEFVRTVRRAWKVWQRGHTKARLRGRERRWHDAGRQRRGN